MHLKNCKYRFLRFLLIHCFFQIFYEVQLSNMYTATWIFTKKVFPIHFIKYLVGNGTKKIFAIFWVNQTCMQQNSLFYVNLNDTLFIFKKSAKTVNHNEMSTTFLIP